MGKDVQNTRKQDPANSRHADSRHANSRGVDEALLRVQDLKKYFTIQKGSFSRPGGYVYAVDGVSFSVKPGRTFGLVGESGCGKTTVGRTILRLTPATGGKVYYQDIDVLSAPSPVMNRLRREMQIVFQDPFSSLNPRMTIGEIVGEPLLVHRMATGRECSSRVEELLHLVGLQAGDAGRYPHELSGGQRQRVGLARALSMRPRLVVCDEPVSALDVSIQSQILNLLGRLQGELGLAYVFISHALNVVRYVSDEVGVMYLGKLVEVAPADQIFTAPYHPYTEALLSAIPVPDPKAGRHRMILEGDVPSPSKPPAGCRFHTRCRRCKDVCTREEPRLVKVDEGRSVACHLAAVS